ncbi:MAG: hypothetical protein V4501_04090 [Pseudomonadota bacterium]
MLVKRNILAAAARSSPFLFLILLLLILLVNTQIIYQDLMYPEQPMLYLVNQKIHSWSALLGIYLHPRMLDPMSVPFFRPSGHFLLYQVISPWIGWHNTRGLLVVNFIFLALMGVMMLKVYELLFPGFKTGGYIAFAICLMHPLFLISRFTIMHFEYASIFFLLTSLYCFMIFCQKNLTENASAKPVKFKNFNWLVLSLLSYAVAATFKETTIMLMPALLIYFFQRFNKSAYSNLAVLSVVVLITAAGGLLAAYLWSAWQNLQFSQFIPMDLQELLAIINKYLQFIFSFPHAIPGVTELNRITLWEINLFPRLDSAVMLLAVLMLAVNGLRIFFSNARSVKQSVAFLYFCAGLFLVLPIAWDHPSPWHAALSLVFLSLLIGFAVEDFLQSVLAEKLYQYVAAYSVALFIALSTISVNDVNFQYLMKHPMLFNYSLNRNAVQHPPKISQQLNNDSVLVVEDRLVPHSDYLLGDSVYPWVLMGNLDQRRSAKEAGEYRYPYVYGGTLFRWAYLKAELKEQIYPFQVENMGKIANDEIIYNWLQHYNNIFCLGFDNNGQWYDKTSAFKMNLLQEQLKRHLIVNHYKALPATALASQATSNSMIMLPDSMACKLLCDKMPACAGFTYSNKQIAEQKQVTVCSFYQTMASQQIPCDVCTTFIKETA